MAAKMDWRMLRELNYRTGKVSPSLKALDGKLVKIPGFIVPLDVAKDACGFRCIEHPDGQLLQTREKESFLVINGIQTQSAKVHNLVGDMPGPESHLSYMRPSAESGYSWKSDEYESLMDQAAAEAIIERLTEKQLGVAAILPP